jgi:TonB family protein
VNDGLILLRAFWIAMATHIWQSSLVLAVLAGLAWRLRRESAETANTLWRLGLLKLLLPLPLLGPLLQRLSPRVMDRVSAALWGHEAGPAGIVTRLTIAPLSILQSDPTPASLLMERLLVLMTALWCSGALAILLWSVAGAARGRRRAIRRSDLHSETVSRLNCALAGTGIPRRRIRITGDRTMPSAAGIFRPRISLPEEFVHAMEPVALRGILLHEMAHCRRQDPLFALLGRLAFALFFFYPPLRTLNRRLSDTAELACDERVLAAGVPATTYRRALTGAVRLGLGPAPSPAAAHPDPSPFLVRRLDRLSIDWRTQIMRKHRLTIAVAATLVAGFSFMPTSLPPAAPALIAAGSDSRAGEAAGELTSAEVDTEPKVIAETKIQPAYPESARSAAISGSVVLEAVIGKDGKIRDIEVVKSPEGGTALARAAEEAVKQWRYEPATLDGQTVAVLAKITVKFRLE